MSQLIDKLNKVARAALQPMGFRISQTASSEPRMLLVASMAQSEVITGLTEVADAVLLRPGKSGLTANTIQKTAKALSDIPWGVQMGDTGAKSTEALVKAGCDYLVFTAASQISAIPEEETLGRILQVESSLDDSLMRAINDLPVDAVLTNDLYTAGDTMAWHHLMLFQRLANLLTKPLLALVPPKTTTAELQALWEARVDGVVVEASAAQLKELRRAIGALAPRSLRKRGKTEALLPYGGGEKKTVTEAEPDEEKDYE